MSRQRVFYYPLILILLFGVAISLMPASPALGSNLPLGVTVQRVNLGPNSVVRTSHTFTIGSGGTPGENGVALLAVRDVISNSKPSAANPYLIKLEPGNYDLGNQSLSLLPFVDLEGSGEGTTVISSTVGHGNIQFTKATLIAASNSEVRSLKVINAGANPFQAAILIPASASNVLINHVVATVLGSTDTNVGLYSDGKNANIADSSFILSGNHSNYGFYHNSGNITLTNTILTAADGSFNNAAIFDNGDEFQILTINNSTLSATGKVFAVAIWEADSSVINLNNTTLTAFAIHAPANQGVADGIIINGGNAIVNVTNSDITAIGTAQAYGIFNVGTAEIKRSSIFANATTSYAINNIGTSGNAGVTYTALGANTAPSLGGQFFCAASINGSTTAFLNSSCK